MQTLCQQSPSGNLIEVERFSEFQRAFEAMKETEAFEKEIKEKIDQISNTLVITEGKTDWKHLKKALYRLKFLEKFSYLNIEFLEFEYE